MKNMKKMQYIMPELTVVEVRAERGYATSDIIGLPQTGMLEMLYFENGGDQETETFSIHNTWTEGSDGFWE